MHPRDVPDPNIDWEYIHYKTSSEAIRPENGWRICKKCNRCLAINNWNFSRSRNSPDGYSYICKECAKKYQKSKRSRNL